MLPDICNVARLKIVLAPGWAFFHPLFHRLPLSRGDRVFPRSLVLVGVVLKVMSIPDVSIPDVATWVLWVPSRRYSLSGWCDSRFFFDNSGLWPRCQDGITQGRMCDGVIVKFFSQGWARGRQTFCCLASCWIHRISKCRNTGREYMWLVFIVGTREFQSNRLQLCPS